MLELKKKAISGIKDLLDDRMAERMKPKHAAVVEETIEMSPKKEGDMAPDEDESLPTAGAHPMEADDSLEAKIESEGGDISKLSPEERATLEQLYEKMGC